MDLLSTLGGLVNTTRTPPTCDKQHEEGPSYVALAEWVLAAARTIAATSQDRSSGASPSLRAAPCSSTSSPLRTPRSASPSTPRNCLFRSSSSPPSSPTKTPRKTDVSFLLNIGDVSGAEDEAASPEIAHRLVDQSVQRSAKRLRVQKSNLSPHGSEKLGEISIHAGQLRHLDQLLPNPKKKNSNHKEIPDPRDPDVPRSDHHSSGSATKDDTTSAQIAARSQYTQPTGVLQATTDPSPKAVATDNKPTTFRTRSDATVSTTTNDKARERQHKLRPKQDPEGMYSPPECGFGSETLVTPMGGAGMCPTMMDQLVQLDPGSYTGMVPPPCTSPFLPLPPHRLVSPSGSPMDCPSLPPPLPTPIPPSMMNPGMVMQQKMDNNFLQSLLLWQHPNNSTQFSQPQILQYQQQQQLLEMLAIEQRQQQQRLVLEHQLRQLVAAQQLQLLEQLLLQQQQERQQTEANYGLLMVKRQLEQTPQQVQSSTQNEQPQAVQPVVPEIKPKEEEPTAPDHSPDQKLKEETPQAQITSDHDSVQVKGEELVGDNLICRKLLLQLQQTPPPPPPLAPFHPIPSSPSLILHTEEPIKTPPIQSTKGNSSRRRANTVDKSQLYCHFCGRKSTPEWRKGPDGPATLCNACGLQWAKKYRSSLESSVPPPCKASGETSPPRPKRRRTRSAASSTYNTTPSPPQSTAPATATTIQAPNSSNSATTSVPTTKPTDQQHASTPRESSRSLRLIAEAASDLMKQEGPPASSPQSSDESTSPTTNSTAATQATTTNNE
ncbi:hypothetical protein Pelo_9510 [Pelomyxa schiedti]|nr:hypothetical protein Pelo_9510 [Pelomyxa schiedti]